MFAVTRPAGRRRLGDRGAVTAIVAVLLAGGVLLAIGAMVVDMGQLYAERQELLSGADAAAMVAAKACADDANCPADLSTITQTATAEAGLNALDGKSDASILCGQVNGTIFGPCPATGTTTKCLGSRPGTGNYIEVGTTTRTADGKTLLPPTFGGALLGSQYQGLQVAACARVAWGAPSSAIAFPVMISLCSWQNATNGGTTYAPPSANWTATDPVNSLEQMLYARWSGCQSSSSSANDDFAILTSISNCTSGQPITAGTDVLGYPAATIKAVSTSLYCQGQTIQEWFQQFFNMLFSTPGPSPHTVNVAVYDSTTTSGPPLLCGLRLFNAFCQYYYHIVGFAAIVITGGVFGTAGGPSWRTLQACGIPILNTFIDPCFTGFFVTGKLSGTVGSGGSYGATAFQQVG
ncbi:MAG TPA: pilus assembly protein TadG-related protein [Streptosporangiaceae bacterium]|nr:pilus assembly protein TadG-related protein [Streptosporangiaceae bacterium]